MRAITVVGIIVLILFLFPFLILNSSTGNESINIYGDNSSKSLILAAINNTDSNVTKYIVSISVVSKDRIHEICSDSKNPVGCTDIRYSSKNEIIKAYIYVANLSGYEGLCSTFNNTIYHEIGHVAHAYYYGYNGGNNPEDFANSYANKFSKESCDKNDKND